MLQVWPGRILKEVSRDPAHFAIIRSEGDAHGQGIHADAYKTGFSILSAMERSQDLVVVLHGFRALCIYQELIISKLPRSLMGINGFINTHWGPD